MADEPPRVVIVSGHMVDAPNRPHARFPTSCVPGVAAEVRRAFDRWNVGPATTVITSGARGADIIGAEEGHARGASVHLVLALSPDEFLERSVALPASNWAERFHALLKVADVDVVGPPHDADAFARANAEIVRQARRLDPHPHALIVWDGGTGDGPGGTQDLVQQLGDSGPAERVHVIDPTHPGD